MRCAVLLALGVALASKAEIAPLQQATQENKANTAKTQVVSVRPELPGNLVPRFLTWIVHETQLLMPPPPQILLVYPNEMHEHAEGSRSVLALYDWEAATIYLPSKWDVTRMYDRALLLHELVHHVQQFNRVGATCHAEHERQAYALTAKWLAEQGVADPYGLLNTDELTVAIFSNCSGPDE